MLPSLNKVATYLPTVKSWFPVTRAVDRAPIYIYDLIKRVFSVQSRKHNQNLNPNDQNVSDPFNCLNDCWRYEHEQKD